ncbi:hypothetical protein [Streptomyces graminilatus]|uniref:hypothetical protein n=1 Tax=Streptomyces graminilatus TaxID=1464070 RepID=UPI0012FEC9F3|nr:hypothetical protein [Streptomyces graminilatus]
MANLSALDFRFGFGSEDRWAGGGDGAGEVAAEDSGEAVDSGATVAGVRGAVASARRVSCFGPDAAGSGPVAKAPFWMPAKAAQTAATVSSPEPARTARLRRRRAGEGAGDGEDGMGMTALRSVTGEYGSQAGGGMAPTGAELSAPVTT